MQPTKNLQTKIIKTCIMKWTGLRKIDTGQLLPRSFWELLSISQALPGTISSSKEYLRNCKLNTLRKSFWCLLKPTKPFTAKSSFIDKSKFPAATSCWNLSESCMWAISSSEEAIHREPCFLEFGLSLTNAKHPPAEGASLHLNYQYKNLRT